MDSDAIAKRKARFAQCALNKGLPSRGSDSVAPNDYANALANAKIAPTEQRLLLLRALRESVRINGQNQAAVDIFCYSVQQCVLSGAFEQLQPILRFLLFELEPEFQFEHPDEFWKLYILINLIPASIQRSLALGFLNNLSHHESHNDFYRFINAFAQEDLRLCEYATLNQSDTLQRSLMKKICSVLRREIKERP